MLLTLQGCQWRISWVCNNISNDIKHFGSIFTSVWADNCHAGAMLLVNAFKQTMKAATLLGRVYRKSWIWWLKHSVMWVLLPVFEHLYLCFKTGQSQCYLHSEISKQRLAHLPTAFLLALATMLHVWKAITWTLCKAQPYPCTAFFSEAHPVLLCAVIYISTWCPFQEAVLLNPPKRRIPSRTSLQQHWF